MMSSIQSESIISTPNASRYLQQLCKHWSHRFTADFDPKNGSVDFGNNEKLLLQADNDQLVLNLNVAERDNLHKMEQVVAEHLQRFAHQEPLQMIWQPK